jgi:hypothetical protein
MTVTPALWEAEVEGLWNKAGPGKV